jgi:hypothetical protein
MAMKKAKKAASGGKSDPIRQIFQDLYAAGAVSRSLDMGKSPSASTRAASVDKRLNKKYDEWAPKSPLNAVASAGYRKGAGMKTGRGKKGAR